MRFLAENTLNEITGLAEDGPGFNYWSEFMNMMITLGFILGLIIVSVWALKRIMRSRIQHLNRSTGIKILERRALNSKSSLYLVDILGKGIVIAESPSGISLLSEFKEEDDVGELLEQLQTPDERSRLSIGQKLRKTLQRRNA